MGRAWVASLWARRSLLRGRATVRPGRLCRSSRQCWLLAARCGSVVRVGSIAPSVAPRPRRWSFRRRRSRVCPHVLRWHVVLPLWCRARRRSASSLPASGVLGPGSSLALTIALERGLPVWSAGPRPVGLGWRVCAFAGIPGWLCSPAQPSLF